MNLGEGLRKVVEMIDKLIEELKKLESKEEKKTLSDKAMTEIADGIKDKYEEKDVKEAIKEYIDYFRIFYKIENDNHGIIVKAKEIFGERLLAEGKNE